MSLLLISAWYSQRHYTNSQLASDAVTLGDLRWKLSANSTQRYWCKGSMRVTSWLGWIPWVAFSSHATQKVNVFHGVQGDPAGSAIVATFQKLFSIDLSAIAPENITWVIQLPIYKEVEDVQRQRVSRAKQHSLLLLFLEFSYPAQIITICSSWGCLCPPRERMVSTNTLSNFGT